VCVKFMCVFVFVCAIIFVCTCVPLFVGAGATNRCDFKHTCNSKSHPYAAMHALTYLSRAAVGVGPSNLPANANRWVLATKEGCRLTRALPLNLRMQPDHIASQ